MTLNLPGGRLQHPVMWLVALAWYIIELARWQHPATWQVALG